jgi:hypothetical protein
MISTGLAERVGIRYAIRLCANGVGYRRGKQAVTPVSSASLTLPDYGRVARHLGTTPRRLLKSKFTSILRVWLIGRSRECGIVR